MDSMKAIGEKAFLGKLLPTLSVHRSFLNGFGHDASIMDIGLEQNIAFKIDRAPYPLAARNRWSDHKTWGRLAVTANLSDLLTVGANAKGFMVSIVVPGTYNASDVEDIILGCQESCMAHHIAFLGGDTKEGRDAQVVGAAFGTVDRGYFLGRRIANAGDRLFVAGHLGGFLGAYLQLQQSKGRVNNAKELIEFISNPRVSQEEALAITGSRKAISGCDLSDGLADALNIFCSNAVGVVLDANSFPLHEYALQASDRLGIERHEFAFGAGDWAIAYVVSERSTDEFLSALPRGLAVKCVGTFTHSIERYVHLPTGFNVPVPNIVNEHFSTRLEDEGSYLSKFQGNE